MAEPEISRFVHLLGGLRAFDVLEPKVSLGVDGLPCTINFDRPRYAELYRDLNSLNLQVIGAEFIGSVEKAHEIAPRDWLVAKKYGGWSIKSVQQNWSNIAYEASSSGNISLSSVSRRIKTYLRLVELRIKKISEAYHNTLRQYLASALPSEKARLGMFSNQWIIEIDAAVHSFLSDAGTLRDVLAEACWSVLLKREDYPVTKMSALLKHAKQTDCPIIIEAMEAARSGWIKVLTDIRNHQIHVAPVSSFHEHTFCDAREIELRGGARMTALHYPFTTSDWKMRSNVIREVDYSDREQIEKSIQSYDAFAKNSGDALEYCWNTVNNFAGLAEGIRLAANLTAPIPNIKPVPGSLKVYKHPKGK